MAVFYPVKLTKAFDKVRWGDRSPVPTCFLAALLQQHGQVRSHSMALR